MRIDKKYKPNKIPLNERVFNIIISSILLVYGTIGIIINDLFFPSYYGFTGFDFRDGTAWIMYGAIICAVLNLMSIVVYHYNKRDNLINYLYFERATKIIGWTLFTLAILIEIIK